MSNKKRKKPSKRYRNSRGKFISKDAFEAAKRERKERKKDKAHKPKKPPKGFSPVEERLKRTRTKKKTLRKNLPTETKTRSKRYEKRTKRFRGIASDVLTEARDWLTATAKPNSKTWVQFAKQDNSRWTGSKVGGIPESFAYLQTFGDGYAKKLNLTKESHITVEVVIVTPIRKKNAQPKRRIGKAVRRTKRPSKRNQKASKTHRGTKKGPSKRKPRRGKGT